MQMSATKNFDYDCTRKCRLQTHGDAITRALTKRSINDQQLAAYIAKTCCNFPDIVDGLGRSAVHLAASVARYAILEWLLNHGAVINGRDSESGSSPLHRAIYYGAIDCAVLLLRYGGNFEILDKDKLSPLHYICRIADLRDAVPLNDILVWGSNKNYNLGIGNEQNADAPQAVDFFRKGNISVDEIALGTYHSFFLDKKRHLYAVGHGNGGRLGVANESSLPAPTKIKIPLKQANEEIIAISVSRKHSLVLTNHSLVYACGLNDDQQLGIRNAGAQLNTFRQIATMSGQCKMDLTNVIACDQYSMVYSHICLHVWGTNVGQFGTFTKDNLLPLPTVMRLPTQSGIKFVAANNVAIAIYTMDDSIVFFYRYKHRLLRPPNFEPLKCISVVGGEGHNASNVKGTATALKLLLLTKSNVVFFWYENTENYYRCSFNEMCLTQIDKILYKANQVLILSQGFVYKGKCQQVPLFPIEKIETNWRHVDTWHCNEKVRTEISREHMVRIDLQRVPYIDRAVEIYCNDDFSSFAVLQESHMKYFKPPGLPRTEYNFKKLYIETSINDYVHDLVFHVDSETYAAHKFIVYSRSQGLRKLCETQKRDKHVVLDFELLTGKMFELILRYIYTNYLPNPYDIECIRVSLGPDSPESKAGVCRLFCDHVARFELNELADYLSSYVRNLFTIPGKAIRFNRLYRSEFPELYDLRIICSNDRELHVHKCVLVARLEYFNLMFTHLWSEYRTINLRTVPIEFMEPIIDYLYSTDVDQFRKEHHSDAFLYKMIIFCDQFFIERLQGACELRILEKINIRKCGEMLDFAFMYNCKLLKQGCMDFICQNLARVFAYGSIEQCEPETLKKLNAHYRSIFKDVFDYRTITPDSAALEDELLLSFIGDFSVDLEYRMGEEQEKVSPKQKELKSKHDTRQCERDAISCMIKSIHMQDAQPANNIERSQAVEDAENVGTQLQNESKNWLKVTDKKEQKRKSAEIAVKANAVLMQETESSPELVSISPQIVAGRARTRQTPERELQPVQPDDPTTPPNRNRYEFDLSSLNPPSQKLSQKQRKRLTSETNNSAEAAKPSLASWRVTKPTAAAPAPVLNAWAILPQPQPQSLSQSQSPTAAVGTSSDAAAYSPPTGSSQDPTSFANMMRSNTSPTTSSASVNNSFVQILADQRRQREQNERMRYKSLGLTQIEETAIAELRHFYNADNISDENIIIERKNKPSSSNFPTWRKH